jgi:hypothetical protein
MDDLVSYMKEQIEKVLLESPGLKGREIAKKIGIDKTEVNSFLAHGEHNCVRDANHCWRLKGADMEITLDGATWINGLSLDTSIKKSGSPLEGDFKSILFIVPEGCKIFLEAAARLLAISNQLALQGKEVTIDFNDCQNTLSFFNRNGFFDFLDKKVVVKPSRPSISGAQLYKGKSEAVYEFDTIDPKNLDEKIPERLKDSFVHYSDDAYSQPAFTVLSELCDNVRDHSESPILGYIALQHYKGHGGRNAVSPHIQTIVSDSGKGITGTLMPVLSKRYPALYKKLDFKNPAWQPDLIREVFSRGMISQSPDDGRGMGLKLSNDVAIKYDATVSVREDTFELKLSYSNGRLTSSSHTLELPKIMGCHICFDFILART